MNIEEHIKIKAQQVKLLVLDVDGVLTDGRLYYGNSDTEIKCFNTLDGHGLKMLKKSGVEVAIITGRTSTQVLNRAKDLGINHVIQGREDKFTALKEILQTLPLTMEQIAMMGDDWPDLTVMCKVGLALSVPNAHSAVKEHSHWISTCRGGEGAVREACDLIMKSQHHYEGLLAQYTTDAIIS